MPRCSGLISSYLHVAVSFCGHGFKSINEQKFLKADFGYIVVQKISTSFGTKYDH